MTALDPKTPIDELAARIGVMPDKDEFKAHLRQVAGLWRPTPGPQMRAFNSQADLLFYGGEVGSMKCLAVDTPIPVPGGWSTMGELRAGDIVFDETGAPCTVIAKSPVLSRHQCYRMEFSDGSTIVCDAGHKWHTWTLKDRSDLLKRSPEWRAKRRASRASRAVKESQKPWVSETITRINRERIHEVAMPTGSIRTTEQIHGSITIRGRTNHSIETAAPLQCEPADLPIDPYLLGAWLGDGVSAGARIVIADDQMVGAVAAAIPSQWELRKGATKLDWGISGGMKVALRTLGVLGNKHIPIAYQRASVEQRIALLQGLMDTDGAVGQNGDCLFCSTRRVLADGVLELARGLGIKATLREGEARLNGRYISQKYDVAFLTDIPAFRLARKLIRQKRAGFRGNHRRRYITAVTQIESVPVACIAVDAPSKMYLCGSSMIPTHNTDLLLGLAFTAHKRSLIMRRYFTDLGSIIDRAVEINGTAKGLNRSAPPKFRTIDGRLIDFGGAAKPEDWEHWRGNPHDFVGIDEVTQFPERSARALTGWIRTTDPNQRTRAVFASNAPMRQVEAWVIEMFKPWLDDRYENPAAPGELRWVVTDAENRDIWVDGPDAKVPDESRPGEFLVPLSRTFIPASLKDNPFIDENYQARVDSMKGDVRASMRGDFMAARKDDLDQLIPTSWVRAAQDRWYEGPPKDVPQSSIGVDGARVSDNSVLAIRHDGWYAPLIVMKGEQTPHGTDLAGLVITNRRDGSAVVIDVAEQIGAQAAVHLKANGIECHEYRGGDSTSERTREGKLQFYNKRARTYWRFREALDPNQPGGSVIALPDDSELVADLTALTWWIGANNKIHVLPKSSKGEGDSVMKRLGRSPDRGDAVVMAWADGAKIPTYYNREEQGMRTNRRRVNFGGKGPRRH